MSNNTMTYRQWQNKSVAMLRDRDNPALKVWEFHCDACGETELRTSEQETIDLVVSHVCR
jgi:hypothetical protein